jgi:hypothetical protein
MAQFVMVLSGATSEEFEKIISIQVRSGDKLKFVPQAVAYQPNIPESVGSGALHSQAIPGQSKQQYHNIRLEWDDSATKFAREVFDLFIKEEKKEEKAA